MPLPIDFVLTWLDDNDPEWIEKRNSALEKVDKGTVDTRKMRTRDWCTLPYFFRGVAKYAPWVNHIYVVTPNQCPIWLNTDHPKITIVDQDTLFDDKSAIPTFNNCAIELLMHKIPGLSEQFVYFNDDMLILSDVSEKDFFRDGLPCITAAISPILPYYDQDGKGTYGIDVSNFSIVAKHFCKKDVMRNGWKKYFDPRNGKELIRTLLCMPFKALPGFNEMHIAYSYLKKTFEEVWVTEPKALSESCRKRFRSDFCLNHHTMRYWQMAKGEFSVRRRSLSRFFIISKNGDETAPIRCIKSGRPKMICINDDIADVDAFEKIAKRVSGALEERFPEKCEFER